MPAFALLMHLNVSYIDSIDDGFLKGLAVHCKQLTVLNLEHCTQISDAGVMAVAQTCTNMIALNMTFDDNITDASLKAIAKHCICLQEIFVGKCLQITNAGVTQIAQHCPDLQGFYAAGCTQLTDDGILPIIYRCTQLRILSVPACNITDDTVLACCDRSGTLSVAQFSFCHRITPRAVSELAMACSEKLNILQLVNCRRISNSFVMNYSQPCPLTLDRAYAREGGYCAIRPPNIQKLGEFWKSIRHKFQQPL
jgi:F-box and leucine-rich repeat protein GRR1